MEKQKTLKKTTELAPKPIVAEDVKLDNPLTDRNIIKDEVVETFEVPTQITKETIMQVVCTKTEVTEMLEPKRYEQSIELVLEDYKTLERPSDSDKLIVQYLECALKEMARDIKVVDEEIVK